MLTRDNLALLPDLMQTSSPLDLTMVACNTLICSGRGTCSKKDAGCRLSSFEGLNLLYLSNPEYPSPAHRIYTLCRKSLVLQGDCIRILYFRL